MSRTFDTKNVILVEIDKSDLTAFLIDTDLTDSGQFDWRMKDFAEEIIDTIPEYVFADYKGSSVSLIELTKTLRESAKCIYKIKEYNLMYNYYVLKDKSAYKSLINKGFTRRGEFGELILHLLLRDFKDTIPLISKVYFKDAPGVPAHGFDAVHITPADRILWLGESKFYFSPNRGIQELIKDLNKHYNHDFLNEQFIIIKKNLENNSIPNRDYWIDKLEHTSKLADQLNMINIPLLCTFEDDIYNLYPDISSVDAKNYYKIKAENLKSFFDKRFNNPLKPYMNIVLFLLPVKSKNELLVELHTKLWNMQNI